VEELWRETQRPDSDSRKKHCTTLSLWITFTWDCPVTWNHQQFS